MLHIKSFTFNPFDENTYVLYNDEKRALIVDPGMYERKEQQQFLRFIAEEKLKPVRLINTHCHIDHLFGNRCMVDEFGLKTSFHADEQPLFDAVVGIGMQYGLPIEPPPKPEAFLTEKDQIQFGNFSFSVLLTPGHSPGSLCFYCEELHLLIAGDVLFRESIGRSDLPGGDHARLLKSIREQLFTLPEETVVYPGHGPQTTIGHEKKHNPFLI